MNRLILSLTLISLAGGAWAQSCEDLGLEDTPCACQFLKDNLTMVTAGSPVLGTGTRHYIDGDYDAWVLYRCPGQDDPNMYQQIVASFYWLNGNRMCEIGFAAYPARCVNTGGYFAYRGYSGRPYSGEQDTVRDILRASDSETDPPQAE